MPLAYLLDENLRGPLARGLWHHNLLDADRVDFVCVGDLPDLPLGASDLDILAWAERENRLLVSNDRSTLAIHLSTHLSAGRHCPGVFLVERSVMIKSVVDALVVYAHASEPDEWRDRIIYVS